MGRGRQLAGGGRAGIVHIHPGKTNPTHWHTNAQEIVYLLQGECDIETDDETVKLRPGQTLVIPVGARDELTNNGWEPAVYVCSFSHRGRGTLFDNPAGPGAKPLALAYYTYPRHRRLDLDVSRSSRRAPPGKESVS